MASSSNFRDISFSLVPAMSPFLFRKKPLSTSLSPILMSSTSSNLDESEANNTSEGGSSVLGASVNFINSIVGAGIIGLPFAVQQCGFLLGLVLLAFVAFLIDRGAIMIVDCGMKVNKYDFEELAEYLLGPYGYYAVLVSMFLFAYGGQTAYLVVIGDTVPKVVELLGLDDNLVDRNVVVALAATCVILPICLMRDISSLAWTSFISVLADVVLVLIILGAAVMHPAPVDGKTPHFAQSDVLTFNANLFAGIGAMSFAFVCQHNSFIIFRSLKKQTLENWKQVAHISVGFALALCLLLALIGVFAFYPYIQGDVLNNFPSDSVPISVARVLLAVTMVLTYPMELFVSRHCLLSIYYRWKLGPGPERAGKGSSPAVHTNIGQGDSYPIGSTISSSVRLADDSSFHVYEEDDVKDSLPSPSAIHTSERQPHNTTVRSANREFYKTKDSNSSTATSSSRSGSHEQELLNVSIDEEEIANLRSGMDLEDIRVSSSDSFDSVDMKRSPFLSTSSHHHHHQQQPPTTPSISVRFPTILLGTPDVMGLVRKVISPIRKMTFTPQHIPVDAKASHMTDNMDLEMDMKMDSNSAIHTPMMKMMSSTSSSSSSSETLTQQHRRNNKKHLNKNTPPLNRNDYMVAEHKTVVYDCENPLSNNGVDDNDNDDGFNDPDVEMGEIYFSHDSGILMRSLHEDESSPPRHNNNNNKHKQLHTYIHGMSRQLPLQGGGMGDDSNCSASNAATHSKGDVWRATTMEHVAVTVVLWGSTLCIAVSSSDFALVSALTGAVAASMLGFILPALLYFATNWTNLHDTYNAALFLHSIHHEGRPTSIHGCLSHTYQIASMFSSYYLPVLMVIFGLMALLIGVSTILVEYNR